MATNDGNPPQIPDNPTVSTVVREELVSSAVKFLSHPKVQTSTVESRETFLRGKGLTDHEIQVSFQRSAIPSAPVPPQQYLNYSPHTVVPIPPPGYLLQPASTWSRIREILNTVAIIGGVVYGLYILYKRYIAPYLFGPSKKRSPVEESIASLDSTVKASVQELRTDLQKVQTDLERLNEQQVSAQRGATSKQVLDVKSEIASLKGLLLNRKQFPLTSGPSTPLSIPAWQLNGNSDVEEIGDVSETNGQESQTSLPEDTVVINGIESSTETLQNE